MKTLVPDYNYMGHWMEGTKWEIPSKSNPDNINIVTMGPHGLWCTCPRFGYVGNCPHVKSVKSKIENEDAPKYSV